MAENNNNGGTSGNKRSPVINTAERQRADAMRSKIAELEEIPKWRIVSRTKEALNSEVRIKYERKQDSDGKYKYKASLALEKASGKKRPKGVLHRLDYEVRSSFIGDKPPSISKSIDAIQPKTMRGRIGKASLKLADRTAHTVFRTAWKTALYTESTGLAAAKYGTAGAKRIISISSETTKQKLRQKTSQHDTGRAALATVRIAKDFGVGLADSGKSIINHFKDEKQFKIEREKAKLKKSELNIYVSEKQGNARKGYRGTVRLLKKQAKSQAKIANLQMKIARPSLLSAMPIPAGLKMKMSESNRFQKAAVISSFAVKTERIVTKPLDYGAKQLASSAYQKVIAESENNDFIAAIDKTYTVAKVLKGKSESKREHIQKQIDKQIDNIQRLENKQQQYENRLESKQQQRENRLQKSENKLKEKKDINKKKKKRKTAAKDSAGADTARETAKRIQEAVKNEIKKTASGTAAIVLPIAVIVTIVFVFLVFIMSIFQGAASRSSFVLGTYPASDKELAECESTYTYWIWKTNGYVRDLGTENWHSAYDDLKASSMPIEVDSVIKGYSGFFPDKPVNYTYGNSSIYPFEPANYDFDRFKLWSFLSAYYYDFSANQPAAWTAEEAEDVIKSMIQKEYKIYLTYDNTSRWEELSSYDYFGLGGSEFFVWSASQVEQNSVKILSDDNSNGIKYKFKSDDVSELDSFKDSDGYVCVNENYEVLNAKKSYDKTGHYVRDLRYYCGDDENYNCPFFVPDSSDEFYFERNGNRYYANMLRNSNGFCWFILPNTNAKDAGFSAAASDSNVAYVAYYQKEQYVTDCELYYNVKKLKTFDEVIESILTSQGHGAERLELYEMYLNMTIDESTTLAHGNHQMMKSLFDDDMPTLLENGKLMHSYGYEVVGWNRDDHCSLNKEHECIDVKCPNNTDIIAPTKCVINDYKSSDQQITLLIKDVKLWYLDDKKHDVKVTLKNVELKSDFSKGDEINYGDVFAVSTSNKNCISPKIENETAGVDYVCIRVQYKKGASWQDAEPILMFY